MNINPKHKIALVICWYGEWPWYFKFFVHSVKYNPTIDFIIITDEKIEIELPNNIKVINKKLEDIKQLAAKKLGFKVAISNAYKLCDFKPAYGLIFEEYLLDYDFWGHGDIDMIFGDIRNFITDEILDTHDVINTRHDFITGFFLLYRNIDSFKTLFTKSKDYIKVFSTDRHFCFDECNFLHNYLAKGIPLEKLPAEIESMEHVIHKGIKQKEVKAYFNFIIIEGTSGKLKWENGKLFFKERYECLFFHIVAYKRITFLKISNWNIIPDTYYINSFYLSRYTPQSLVGLIEGIKKSREIFFYKTAYYLEWWLSRLYSTKKVKTSFLEQKNCPGIYKCHNSIVFIMIDNKKNMYFIDYLFFSVALFRHISNNIFLSPHGYCRIRFYKNTKNELGFTLENVFKWGWQILNYKKV